MVVSRRSMAGADGSDSGEYSRRLDPIKSEISYLGDIVSNSTSEPEREKMGPKRMFDLLFAAISMILLSPVLLIAALMIKVESPGPVFFKQERIGLNRRRKDRRNSFSQTGLERRRGSDRRKNIHAGKPFHIYKLRTMRQDAEASGPMLARTGDPRITRVGNFLRKTRIDEIPQFINVIKGDMSIIGPRPERSFYINQIKSELPEFPLRLRVKPGITGLAQVEDGYAQTLDMMKTKLFFDLKYISSRSLLKEMLILVKTVTVVFTGKGAC